MPLSDCEVNLILTWLSICVINMVNQHCVTNSKGAGRFTITEIKLYDLVVTLSNQDNTKLLQQLKSGFKRSINCNKYQPDPKTCAQNRYLNHLVDPSFEGVNKLFVLSFENDNDSRSYSNYYLPKAEIKDYNVMIDGKNVFDQPVNNHFKTYENNRNIATGQGDDYTTGYLLDYPYFKENYKMIAIDLSKKQVLDGDPRAIQQINFTENLDRARNTTMFFIIDEVKETILYFSQGTVKVL